MTVEQVNTGGASPVVSLATPEDPRIVEAVEDALAGDAIESPELQPNRTLHSPQDFASLYLRHRSSFEAHARKFHNDQRDVDEVVQETFLRLFLAMPEIENELQALAFSRRVLTNLCIDRYRAAQRRPMLVALDNMDAEVRVDEFDDPVARAEDAAIVRQALALLSPLHRAALVKREIEEKPLSQIAVELDIPEENVKHLLHRARRALRRLLVGTTVQPDVDLTNGEMLRIANERLAKATLRGANVLIVMFVAVFAV
ncbi:MAG TPA: RNA polymerase sigma factor, partial [Mycobacteriales bacterium]|nr:RNA polymerase sigma factor [Mycobacteriales bacterium]